MFSIKTRIARSIVCLFVTWLSYSVSWAQCASAGMDLYDGNMLQADSLCKYLGVEKYKIVFWGEQHNDQFDPELKYHLLASLHKNYGFRHVFIEEGFSAAWLYNQYLKTGDTTLLQTSAGYRQFWRRMYEYNKPLPDSLRIIFRGIDFERVTVFHAISSLIPAGEPVPAILQPVMDTIKAHLHDKPLSLYSISNGKMTFYDNTAFEMTLRYVQKQFLQYSIETKAFFGSNYLHLEGIIENKGEITVSPRPRNKTMFENMKHIVAEQGIEKFVGFFGNEHTSYAISSSLPNQAKNFEGVKSADILNISSVVYNRTDNRGVILKGRNEEMLKGLNGNCAATVHPATDVPGFKKNADYVVIVNLAKAPK